MGNVNLFDAHNRINFPNEDQIASMSKEARQQFKPVREAKAKLDAATKHREATAQRIKDNDAERAKTTEQMIALRPKWTETDNIKAHIQSEQRQRRLERGLVE
jgi:hypothetical protein